MSIDIEKLVKILGMTGSSHDAEALVALRTALKMMAAAKVTWKDLLQPTVTVNKDDAAATQAYWWSHRQQGKSAYYEEYVRQAHARQAQQESMHRMTQEEAEEALRRFREYMYKKR